MLLFNVYIVQSVYLQHSTIILLPLDGPKLVNNFNWI